VELAQTAKPADGFLKVDTHLSSPCPRLSPPPLDFFKTDRAEDEFLDRLAPALLF